MVKKMLSLGEQTFKKNNNSIPDSKRVLGIKLKLTTLAIFTALHNKLPFPGIIDLFTLTYSCGNVL
jgi:hypothetical protein